MRSLLRWLRRVALTALALTVAGIAAVLITAHTAWGREQLRTWIEAALRDAFPGGARVAALDGSVLGTLTLRTVELDGLDHLPLVTAGELRVKVALWPLILRTARLDRLVAEDVAVFVREQQQQQQQQPVARGTVAPSPWQIEAPDIAVHRATIAIERAGMALGDLELDGALSGAAGRVELHGAVRGRWTRAGGPAAALTATAAVVIDGGVRVPTARVTLDGASLTATALVLDAEHLSGGLTLAAPQAVIARLLPELSALPAAVPGDVTAAIELSPDGPATRIAVTATAGDARLWLALRGEPGRRTARGVVSLTAIDLARATLGQVRGRGNLLAVLDAGAGELRGALIAAGELAMPGLPIRRAGVAMFGSLDGVTAVAFAGGDDALQLAAVTRGRRAAGRIVMDDARAVATARAVTLPCGADPRCRRVTGKLAARARATGTLAPALDVAVTGVADGTGVTVEGGGPAGGAGRAAAAALRSGFAVRITRGRDAATGLAIAITGDAAGTALAYDEVGAAAAIGSFALGAPALRLDHAHVTARGVRRAGRVLGDARIDLARRGAAYDVIATARPAAGGVTVATEASVGQAGATYRATLGRSSVALLDGTVWSGRGGAVAASEPADPRDPAGTRIQLRGLTLHRGDAAITLSGDYAGGTGNLAARVDADRVEVSSIDARARGLVRGTIDVARRGGQWQAAATLAAAGLATAPDATPVDATAELALGHGRATLDAHATGGALGGIDLTLDVAAPRDPLDLAAWRRLDRAAIRRAAITARQIALPGLAGLAWPTAGAPAATIDGSVDLAPAALHGELAVRGVALPSGVLDGEVTLAPHDGDLDARASARLAGVAAADVTARLAVPRYPFDPATWRHRGRDLVQGATARLADVAFDPALVTRLGVAGWLADHGIAARYRGRASAQLTLGAGARDAQLAIDLDGVTGGALIASMSQHLAITAGPARTHVRVELHSGEIPLGVLDGDLAMTLDRWRDEPVAALYTPLTARWTLPVTPLVPVLAGLGHHELEAGTLEGSAALGGSIVTPIISAARLVVRDLRVAAPLGGRSPPAITELEVAGTWSAASGSVHVHGREATGGELRAEASGSFDTPAAATGTARLTRFDIAPIAALLPGALISATGVVDGELALRSAGRVTGDVHITGGALPLAPAIGTLRDATAHLTLDARAFTAVLDSRLGRGTIHLEADAPAGDLATATARLRLREVSPIAALRPIVTADVTVRLHRGAGQLRGDVTAERGSITLPERAGTPLLDATVPSDLELVGAPAAPRGPRVPTHPWLVLDVALGATRVDARELAEGLGFTGTLQSDRLELSIGDAIGVHGRVDIASADVDLLGRRYVVEPSDLTFDGTTDPLLGILMNYRFPDLTLKVAVRGRASRPDLQLSSDAGSYSNDQLFGFFLGGEPSADPGSQTRTAVAAAGTRLISGKLGQQINRVLPVKVDALSCEPSPTATTATSGSCTVGKWLSRRLFIAYRQHLQPRTDENTGDVQLQLRLGDRLLLEGTGGDRGYYGADLLWRHRW